MEVAPPKNHSYQPADPSVFLVARILEKIGAVAGMLGGIFFGFLMGCAAGRDMDVFVIAGNILFGMIAGGVQGGVFMALAWRVVMIFCITINSLFSFGSSLASKVKE